MPDNQISETPNAIAEAGWVEKAMASLAGGDDTWSEIDAEAIRDIDQNEDPDQKYSLPQKLTTLEEYEAKVDAKIQTAQSKPKLKTNAIAQLEKNKEKRTCLRAAIRNIRTAIEHLTAFSESTMIEESDAVSTATPDTTCNLEHRRSLFLAEVENEFRNAASTFASADCEAKEDIGLEDREKKRQLCLTTPRALFDVARQFSTATAFTCETPSSKLGPEKSDRQEVSSQ